MAIVTVDTEVLHKALAELPTCQAWKGAIAPEAGYGAIRAFMRVLDEVCISKTEVHVTGDKHVST